MHQDSISHHILIFWKCFNGWKKHFCVSNQKIRSFNFKVYYNRFLYFHTFLRKTLWKLYDPFITFRLQMWRMNYLHISKSFSVCLWNIFENITGMPLRGHLLAARMKMLKVYKSFSLHSSTRSRKQKNTAVRCVDRQIFN